MRHIILFSAAFLAPMVITGQSQVSITQPSVGLSQIPLWIADEQGLFARHGVEALILNTDRARPVEKEIQIGVMGIPAAIAAVARGRDLKLLLTLNSELSDGYLVVRPGIHTAADLRGKRFGVLAIGKGYWISSILALQRLGLEPKRDRISFLEVGDLLRIVQSLQSGEIDAATLDPAQTMELKSKGFPILLDMRQANVPGIQSGMVVAGDYLRQHPDVVEKAVTALVEGIAFSLSPANERSVLKTMTTHLRITSLEAAGRGYESFLSRANRKLYASVAAIKSMQRVMALDDPKVLNVKVEEMIEERFLRKLDESGALDRIYSAYGVK